MAKTETLNLEVKSNIKSVTKDTDKLADSVEDVKTEARDAAGEFSVMGISLNDVKAAMGKVIPISKAMFGSIKAGLISTGIGAFIVAIGSLVAWFTRTKKGAEVIETAFKTVGTAVSVVLDRIGGLGNAIALFFQGKWAESAAAAKAAISGIGAEIVEETTAMIALTQASQKLADAQRDLNIETAKAVADIEKLKLTAEDITKSYKDREEAANLAFAKETELENKRIELAEEAVRIEKERHLLLGKDGVMAEDLDALAELEINLANIRQESAGRQISLQNFLNGLRETEKAQKDADKAEADADKIAAEERAKSEADFLLALQNENTLALITDLEKRALKELEIQEKKELASAALMENFAEVKEEIEKKFTRKRGEIGKKAAEDQVKWSEMSSKQQLDIASTTAGNLVTILGEETAAGKAMAVVQATIDTYKGATAAYASMAGIPVVGPGLGVIAAGAAVAAGLKNVQAIMSTGDGGGGGGPTPSTPTATTAPPAPQMMSGAFELTGATEPQPIQAFVVSDEITDSQNGLEIIRRRATI
jgi:predicted amino acid-binding ACT domain protein